MNEAEILNKITELELKVDRLENTIKKTKKYVLVFLIISVVAFVFPLIGLLFAIPSFLDSYSQISNIGI